MSHSVCSFYYDLDATTGYGHRSRCEALNSCLRVLGIQCHLIENSYDKSPSESEFIVVDSYRADLAFYKACLTQARRCLFFDDYDRLRYPGGLVLNPSGEVGKDNLAVGEREAQYICGAEYLMVRDMFASRAVTNSNVSTVKNVLVILGSGASSALWIHVLKAVCDIFTDAIVHVVGGSSIAGLTGTVLYYSHLEPESLANLMVDCDFAVSAGGQTLLELVCCGVPTAVLVTAKNQNNQVMLLQSYGVVQKAEIIDLGSVLQQFLDCSLRETLVRRMITLNLGQGAKRVCDLLLKRG